MATRSLGPLRAAVFGLAAVLVCVEVLRPLRRWQREPKRRRVERNVAVAGLAAVTVQLLEQPVVGPLARLAEDRRWGLLGRARLPEPLNTVFALVALDYTLYLWHVLVHRVPALWRFHAVHHADLDLDASTAIRFHFGELAASVPWRAAQVAVIGVDAAHARDVAAPDADVDPVPPLQRPAAAGARDGARLRGGHATHARHPPLAGAATEMSSNWSSGLSLWDRLHGTLRTDVPQDEIFIGVDGFDSPREVTFSRMLLAPFVEGHVAGHARREGAGEGRPGGAVEASRGEVIEVQFDRYRRRAH